MGEPGLTQQSGLLHGTVDFLHFISNHLFIMPLIKIVIHVDAPTVIAWAQEAWSVKA